MKTVLFVVLFFVVISIIVCLPTISINVDAVVASNVFAYIRAALYFIPVGTVTTILGIMLSLWLFRMLVALVKTIWDMLPVV